MKKRQDKYKIIAFSCSLEISEILDSIIEQAKAKGKRINKSQLIESMIYDSIKASYIQSQLKKDNKEEIN